MSNLIGKELNKYNVDEDCYILFDKERQAYIDGNDSTTSNPLYAQRCKDLDEAKGLAFEYMDNRMYYVPIDIKKVHYVRHEVMMDLNKTVPIK